MTRLLLAFLLVALGASACATPGADTPTTDASAPSAAPPAGDADGVLVIADGAAVDGPGITIADALSGQAGDGPVLVAGALFVDPDGTVRLCDAMMESFPPQCGGARLRVEGLDPDAVPNLESANGVRWAEGVVRLFGQVEPAD